MAATNLVVTDADGYALLVQPLEASIREHGTSIELFWIWQLHQPKPEYQLVVSSDHYHATSIDIDSVYGAINHSLLVEPRVDDAGYTFRGYELAGRPEPVPVAHVTVHVGSGRSSR